MIGVDRSGGALLAVWDECPVEVLDPLSLISEGDGLRKARPRRFPAIAILPQMMRGNEQIEPGDLVEYRKPLADLSQTANRDLEESPQ